MATTYEERQRELHREARCPEPSLMEAETQGCRAGLGCGVGALTDVEQVLRQTNSGSATPSPANLREGVKLGVHQPL
jgi:hypothetical protein